MDVRIESMSLLEERLEPVVHMRALWWVLYVIAFLPATMLLAARTPLSSDEVYTVLISRLPSGSDIWSVLQQGLDLNPPVIYFLTRWSQAMFGQNEWAIRLPGVIGSLIFGLCLVEFVARRMNYAWGFLAGVFAMFTGIYGHVAEARPYGVVLGCVGIALVCWQKALAGERRILSLCCMTVSLGFALACHYYAVLVLVPFGCVELVRLWKQKRLDVAVSAAVVASLATLLLLLPLMSTQQKKVAGWDTAHVKLGNLVQCYEGLRSTQGWLAILLVLGIGVLCSLFVGTKPIRVPFEWHEFVLSVSFFLLPFFGYLFAVFVTHNLTGRYVLAYSIGAAVLFAIAAYVVTRGSSTGALLLCATIGGMFFVHKVVTSRGVSLQDAPSIKLDARYPDLPVVVGSGQDFPPTWFYANAEARRRMVFVSDHNLAVKYSHGDLANTWIRLNEPVFHWPVMGLEEFRSKHQRFLLTWTDGERWVLPAYQDMGAQVEVLKPEDGSALFLVTEKPR